MMYIFIIDEERWEIVDMEGVKENTYAISTWGQIKNIHTDQLLTPQVSNCGYMRIMLRTEDPKEHSRQHSIHKMVATAFVPNPDPENKTQVNHKNGNKKFNFYENLEWVSHAENLRHAVREKLHWQYVGEKHPNSKYTNKFVYFIDDLLQEGKALHEIYIAIRKNFPEYNWQSERAMKSFIGRIRRRDRYGKILNNRGSTTIERNID